MGGMTRRDLFKMIAGSAALVAVPALATVDLTETIWADGIHDDGPGLTALIRGDVVRFADPEVAARVRVTPGHIDFDRVRFYLKSPVFVDGKGNHVIDNVHLISGDDFEGEAAIVLRGRRAKITRSVLHHA